MKKRQRPQNALQKPMVRWSWFFLLPMVSAFAIGFVWPFLQGIYLSFCEFRLISNAKWVGFKNYADVFKDTNFLRSFGYTAIFAIVSLIIINVLAFLVAYVLTLEIKGSNLFRTVFFMPNLIGGIVLGYIWNMIFDGILSQYGTSIVQESTGGFWGLILLLSWQQIGYMMIIYIAGLQAVPGDMLEAAKIDGASGIQTLFRVIIPNVMPSITICTFLALTNGFKLFDQNLALTGGLPYIINPDGSVIKTTEMVALNIYSTFYSQGAAAPGFAQAKAVIFFIVVATLSILQLTFTRKKEVQQ
ncbi:MAG: sugar ABC transporter permease [Clostridia bacterium]|nr:sugar ABC transporter permease [Clostridia bacterium]